MINVVNDNMNFDVGGFEVSCHGYKKQLVGVKFDQTLIFKDCFSDICKKAISNACVWMPFLIFWLLSFSLAPWCSGYHYCKTSFNKAWTQVLHRFKCY